MSANWVNKLKESDSRLHKEAVVKSALDAATAGDYSAAVFLGLVKACYNPYVVFGVKQVADTTGITGAENPWGEFNVLLQDLFQRKITGGAARQAIEAMAARFDSVEWNTVCAPVIRRDLRAGISDKTVNKIAAGTEFEIPVFSVQLATSCDGRPEMRGVKRLEPKLDGVRVALVVTPDGNGGATAVCYSRNGKPFDNFKHIEEQIVANWRDLARGHQNALLEGFVLDGEVIGATFQELMRQARRKENVQADDSVFNIFDILPLNEFLKGGWKTPLEKRLLILEHITGVVDRMPNVELLPHIMVDLDTAEGKTTMHDYAQEQVAAGFEGVMIKDPKAPYRCKRTTDWMKWKPTNTVDLEVIDVEEGTGRNVGRLGALVCAGQDDGRDIKVNCGSGFSDADRDNFWRDRDMVVGRTVEVLCDVITKNQDGTYSLRFPRFVRFRDDK